MSARGIGAALASGLGAAVLAGCAGDLAAARPEDGAAADTCRRGASQAFIGKIATAELGARMLQATGASRIRWVPPHAVVTMEYAYGRLTVGYDEAMRIVSVACG